MTNMQAAIGLAQLERLDDHVRRKRDMGSAYQDELADLPCVQLPLPATDYADNIYWVFGVLLTSGQLSSCHSGLDVTPIMQQLSDWGVGTRPFFWPIHQQPVFRKRNLFAGESYPVAESLARSGFYLPSGLGLSADDIHQAADALRRCLLKPM